MLPPIQATPVMRQTIATQSKNQKVTGIKPMAIRTYVCNPKNRDGCERQAVDAFEYINSLKVPAEMQDRKDKAAEEALTDLHFYGRDDKFGARCQVENNSNMLSRVSCRVGSPALPLRDYYPKKL